MAKLVFGMNQSLDGYVDHMAFAPGPALFRHFIEEAQGQAGSVYGRQMYEIMRYWDDDHPEWGAAELAFAAAWRNQPKWVVSRSLKSVRIESICTPSCSVTASHISPGPGRRSVLWLMIASARM